MEKRVRVRGGIEKKERNDKKKKKSRSGER